MVVDKRTPKVNQEQSGYRSINVQSDNPLLGKSALPVRRKRENRCPLVAAGMTTTRRLNT
jgi:hypothetical protein